MDLVEYEVAKRLPPDERYVLSSQLRRAAISVAANVTEGYARSGSRQLRAFLDIALGSARECELLLLVAVRVGSIGASDIERTLHAVDTVAKQLYAILRSLRMSGR